MDPRGRAGDPHLDVLYPNDIQEIVPDNTGTPVTPYDNGTNGGVSNPWAAYQYLDTNVGYVTTPNAGPLPADCCWVYRVRTPAAPGDQYMAVQWSGHASNHSWWLNIRPDGYRDLFTGGNDGTGFVVRRTSGTGLRSVG